MRNETVSSVLEYIQKIQNITGSHSEIAHHEYYSAKERTYRTKDTTYDMAIAKRVEEELKNVVDEEYAENRFSKRKEEVRYKFFYRGHFRRDYRLLPSVFRKNELRKEDYYYHEIMVRCPEHFQFLTHLDKLVLMQHYDCPTRLLDVTTNPLVALYFACKNFGCNTCDTFTGGTVHLFAKRDNEVVYSDSDKALMLSCIPKFTSDVKRDIWRLCQANLSAEKFVQRKGGSRYQDDNIERLFHEIATENPAFKRELVPLDLLQPLFVQPNKGNKRILKQDGAFILSGLSRNEDEAEEKIKKIWRVEINANNQETILKELEGLGIHEAVLFPEVDKVANYLKGQ